MNPIDIQDIPYIERSSGYQILTHPNNVELLKKSIETHYDPYDNCVFRPFSRTLDGFEIITNINIPQTQKTNRIIDVDGKPKDKAGWTYKSRFITYEESDLPWLLGLGYLKYEEAPVFYMMQKNYFEKDFFHFKNATVFDPRHSLKGLLCK